MMRLAKAWKHLPLSQSRKDAGARFLKWRSDESEDEGEPNKQSLENNCPMVYVMYEILQNLDTVPIKPLMAQVPWFKII